MLTAHLKWWRCRPDRFPSVDIVRALSGSDARLAAEHGSPLRTALPEFFAGQGHDEACLAFAEARAASRSIADQKRNEIAVTVKNIVGW
jgi:hypothetical protein